MSNSKPYIYGIDLGKNWFHVVAADQQGNTLFRKKLTRNQFKLFVANTPAGRVAFEA